MENKKVTNRMIAEYIGKSPDTVNGWKKRQPELLELAKLGMTCKQHELDVEKIQKLSEIQNIIKK
jgi:hypothetical protein